MSAGGTAWCTCACSASRWRSTAGPASTRRRCDGSWPSSSTPRPPTPPRRGSTPSARSSPDGTAPSPRRRPSSSSRPCAAGHGHDRPGLRAPAGHRRRHRAARRAARGAGRLLPRGRPADARHPARPPAPTGNGSSASSPSQVRDGRPPPPWTPPEPAPAPAAVADEGRARDGHGQRRGRPRPRHRARRSAGAARSHRSGGHRHHRRPLGLRLPRLHRPQPARHHPPPAGRAGRRPPDRRRQGPGPRRAGHVRHDRASSEEADRTAWSCPRLSPPPPRRPLLARARGAGSCWRSSRSPGWAPPSSPVSRPRTRRAIASDRSPSRPPCSSTAPPRAPWQPSPAPAVSSPRTGWSEPDSFGAYAREVVAISPINVLAYEPVITADERATFEERIDGPILDQRGGELIPASERPLYYPVRAGGPRDAEHAAP